MKPRAFHLTEAEVVELRAAYQHCQGAKAKTRYQAARLYGTGYAVAQIVDICGCPPRNLSNWVRAYRQRGLTALLDHRLGGNRARLTPAQIEAVQNLLHRDTPAQLLGRDNCPGGGQSWTVPDLARLLERDSGVVYESQTSYRALRQKCGLSYRRPARQYKSHSGAKLMDFEEALGKKTAGRRPGCPGHGDPGRR